MIQKPTVQELLEHAENRYSLVIATSRRARQIAKGDSPKIESNDKSPVTIAANEIAQGKVKVYKQGEEPAEEEFEENTDNIENEEVESQEQE